MTVDLSKLKKGDEVEFCCGGYAAFSRASCAYGVRRAREMVKISRDQRLGE